MSPDSIRRERDLTPAEREELDAAYSRLEKVQSAYNELLRTESQDKALQSIHNLGTLADAEEDFHSAEDELWELRERLLGWKRPS